MNWLLGIGIALLLLLALGWLLPGLLRPRGGRATAAAGANAAVYRDQLREAERDLAADLITSERFEQLRAEIQHRVLEDTAMAPAPAAAASPARRTALVLALLLPAASVATYLALGQPAATLAPAAADSARHEVGAEQIEAMVARLAERLQAEPANPEGWQMLARSQAALGRHADAVAALRQLDRLQPDNPDTLADLADLVAVVNGRRLAGEPAQLVQRALALNPLHPKALALAGTIAFDAGDYAAARDQWQRLVAQLPADSELARNLQDSIAEADRLAAAGGASAPAVPTPASAPAAASTPAAAGLGGEVVVSPELAGRVAAGDTVYVFARAADGPRMPLAIVRQPVGSWPLRFTLDDRSAMTPQSRLSAARSVVVVARISRSGDALPQRGDLIGESAPLGPNAQGVRIVIDRVQP
ncbi:MAG: c-type cytochrome biogenesis protein CcmI [Rubrivivax sp.]|nr:c-type cytochrome biogenesis protein CcmI [Rubrivivax sp.]